MYVSFLFSRSQRELLFICNAERLEVRTWKLTFHYTYGLFRESSRFLSLKRISYTLCRDIMLYSSSRILENLFLRAVYKIACVMAFSSFVLFIIKKVSFSYNMINIEALYIV